MQTHLVIRRLHGFTAVAELKAAFGLNQERAERSLHGFTAVAELKVRPS